MTEHSPHALILLSRREDACLGGDLRGIVRALFSILAHGRPRKASWTGKFCCSTRATDFAGLFYAFATASGFLVANWDWNSPRARSSSFAVSSSSFLVSAIFL